MKIKALETVRNNDSELKIKSVIDKAKINLYIINVSIDIITVRTRDKNNNNKLNQKDFELLSYSNKQDYIIIIDIYLH